MLGRSVQRGGDEAVMWRAACLPMALFFYSSGAAATAPGQPYRLEYWARGTCPDAAEFARQIQTRAPRLRPAESDEPALGFYAELEARGDSATGLLTARSPDGREVRREVRGATCDDVVTALALIAALAADPNQPITAPETSGPRNGSHARVASAPPPSGSAPQRAVPGGALPELEEPILPDRSERWTYGLGGGLAFNSNIAPSPGYGFSVAFEAEGPEGSVLRSLLGVSANLAVAESTETAAGNASFTWLAFRMTACPFRWPAERPLFVRPCALLDAGELEGKVTLGDQGRDRTRAWFALGAFGRLEALIGEAMSFQLDGGFSASLEHDEFRAGAGAPTAFRVPNAGMLGRIGLSYRFQ